MKILCSRPNLRNEVDILSERIHCSSLDNNRKILIYNISIKNVIIAFLYRIKNYKLYWLRHEVTCLKQKLINNSLQYSISVRILEICLQLICYKVATPNPEVARAHSLYFCPLPYKLGDKYSRTKDIDILFVGREDIRRSEALFELLQGAPGVTTLRIGGPNSYVSEEQKREYYRRSKFVLNRYTGPIGQSGVTPDALSNRCGVIVSEYEFAIALTQTKKLICLSSSLSDTECRDQILALLSLEDEECDVFERDFDEIWGPRAFEKYWLSFLR